MTKSSGKLKKRLLFYGELPPGSVHGISYSNKINIELLQDHFEVDLIIERARPEDHTKNSFSKCFHIINDICRIFLQSIKKKYSYFYLVFSLSTLGSIKTLAAILAFRLINKGKVILHIHRGDFFSHFLERKHNETIAKSIFRLSHKNIVLSERLKDHFISVYGKSFFVLPNTTEFEFPVNISRTGKKRYLYISNYLAEKGIIELINVFRDLEKELPDISLTTYGVFSDIEMKTELLKIKSMNTEINDSITGVDKMMVIEESDCLILPSRNEGQPLVILEAMSVGTPVIATRVGLVPEVLGEDYPYLAEPDSENSLKECILKFVTADTRALAETLKERYYKYYSKENHKSRLMEILDY